MSWEPREVEIAAVLRLDREARYRHAIKRMADTEQLWTLRSAEGFVMGEAANGTLYVPVWPHARYAQLCAVGDSEGCEPEPIPLEEWMELWTPGLRRDGRSVAVFPAPGEMRVLLAQPDRFAADLAEECEQYEL